MKKELREPLQQLVGQLVWSVKRGHGTFLTMEFGAPHLAVREPIQSKSDTPRVERQMARRRVSIRGDFSLFIQDSQWSISEGDQTVGPDSSEAIVGEALRQLDGQCASAVNFDEAGTIIEFDLGGIVRLGKSIFPTEPKSRLWSLTKFGTPGLVFLNDGSIVRGDEVVS